MPVSHLLIERQTLTMWPWNDLDLDDIDSVYDFDLIHVNQSQTDVQVAKSAFPISDHYLDPMAQT